MSKTIISLGEIVWDIFPNERKLGGAPLNFAYYAGQNGAHSYIVSALGKDELAEQTMELVKKTGVDYSHIQRNDFPTGQVLVSLSGEGIPQYNIKEDSSWDYMTCTEEVLELASRADAICWGALAQRNECTRESIFKIYSIYIITRISVCVRTVKVSSFNYSISTICFKCRKIKFCQLTFCQRTFPEVR